MDIWVTWTIWIVATLASFGYLEWRGFRRHGTRGTLSSLFWYIIFADWERRYLPDGGIPRKPRWLLLPLIIWPFVWLVLHFVFGVNV